MLPHLSGAHKIHRAFVRGSTLDLLPFKPTVVLTCFGNLSTDAYAASTYGRAQTDLVEALKKAGVRTIVIGSPKCVDSFA